MRLFLLLFLLALFPLQQVEAGALQYTGRIGKAVGNSIKNNTKRLGVAANDAKYARTWEAVNDAAFDGIGASAAVATIAGIAGAPVWGTVVVVVGVGLAVGYVSYKLTESQWHDGGELTVKSTNTVPAPVTFLASDYLNRYSMDAIQGFYACIIVNGQDENGGCGAYPGGYEYVFSGYQWLQGNPVAPGNSQWKYSVTVLGGVFYAMTPEELITRVKTAFLFPIASCRAGLAHYGPGFGGIDNVADCGTPPALDFAQFVYNRILPNNHPDYINGAFVALFYADVPAEYKVLTRGADGVILPCDECSRFPVVYNTNYQPATPVTDYPEKLAPFMDPGANEPLDEKVIVKLANELWKRAAAQPGYEGVPYDAVNPVTVADVQLYKAENPVAYPTQADMLSPAAPTPGAKPNFDPDQAVPNSPSPTPNPNPDQPPGTVIINNPAPNVQVTVNVPAPIVNVNPKVDFGDYPDNGPPDLTGTPTETSIINAIKNQVLPASDFEDSHPAGSCPTPEFTVFDTTFIIDSHCSIFDSIAPIFVTVMSAVWAMLAFFIVMRA